MREAATMHSSWESGSFLAAGNERRCDSRIGVDGRIASIMTGCGKQVSFIRDISAGGMMVTGATSLPVGRSLIVEFENGKRVGGTIRWSRGIAAGIQFDRKMDVAAVMTAGPAIRIERRRGERLDVRCAATVQIGTQVFRLMRATFRKAV